jgi:site-specific recombinase XerD
MGASLHPVGWHDETRRPAHDGHSVATHLLKVGCDIRTVQELLGRRDVRATIYLPVVQGGALGAKSPMGRR